MDRKDELHHDHAGKNHILSHDDHPGVGDHIGEAAGGISGVFAGAAIGSVGGPIGTIIGGIAGAMGGWWAGRTVSEAATHLTHDDDTYYRTHYEGSSTKLADRGYEDVRPAYHLGHIASHNPDYAGRNFDAVETDLRKGWSEDLRGKHGDWDSVRGFARHGYEYGSTRRNAGTAATTGASFYGSGATSSAADKARNTADRVGDKAENAWDRTKAGAQNVGNKLADKADDVKDRVDGNPASKPGPDASDANRRF